MLRMYSVMQLQQVWQKPDEVHQLDEEVLSPPLPVVQEEPETLDEVEEEEEHQQIEEGPAAEDTVATVTTDGAEDIAVIAKDTTTGDIVLVEEPATIQEPNAVEEPAVIEQPGAIEDPVGLVTVPADGAPVVAKETVAVETKSDDESNKRDSKISTGSASLVPQPLEDKTGSPPVLSTLASRATSVRTVEEHPSAPTPKVSRSSQIQAKLSTQRRNFSRKLKRTFSMSSTTSTKRQTL